MSSMVSRRPSSRNHLNEAIWMSIRFGSSRTFSMREKDLRARGDATLVVNRKSLPWDVRNQLNAGVRAMGGRADASNVGATHKSTGNDPFTASEARGRFPTAARL